MQIARLDDRNQQGYHHYLSEDPDVAILKVFRSTNQKLLMCTFCTRIAMCAMLYRVCEISHDAKSDTDFI